MSQIQLISFGFKYGGVKNCDLMVNLCKLPNPSFRERKKKTGLDKSLREDLFRSSLVQVKFQKIKGDIKSLLEKKKKSGEEPQEVIIIALGCHSGMHRSVTLVEELARDVSFWQSLDYELTGVEVIHRELD